MTTTSPSSGAPQDLPELPTPAGDIRLPGAFGLACDGFTADQMRAYVLVDRAARQHPASITDQRISELYYAFTKDPDIGAEELAFGRALVQEAIAARQEAVPATALRELLDQMHHFANCDMRLWDPSMRTDADFKRWVQSRASHLLEKHSNAATPPAPQAAAVESDTERDAARYRWLRGFATPGQRPPKDEMPMGYREIRLRVDTPVYMPSNWAKDVDRLIDAAMRDDAACTAQATGKVGAA